MMLFRHRRQMRFLLAIASAFLVAALARVGADAKGAKVSSPEANLYWEIDRELSQGRKGKAQQVIEAKPEIAQKLHANLLFVKLELNFGLEDAVPISPNMDEILSLLNLVADEPLRKLTEMVSSPSSETKPFRSEEGGLAEVLATFAEAAKSTNLDEQIQLYQAALQKCDALGLELGKLLCLYRLARAELRKGGYAHSIAHSLQSQNLAIKWNYQAKLAPILNNLGITAYRLGLMNASRQYLISALEIAQSQRNEQMQGIILTNFSAVAIREGNFREAEEYLQKAIGFGETVARLTNLGAIYTNLRDYERALVAFRGALELAEKARDTHRQISLWNNIGAIYWLNGDFEKALHCLQRALELAQGTKDLFRTVPVHLTLGLIYTDRGEFELAEKHFAELLSISQQLGDKLGELEALVRIGLLKVRQKRWDEAIKVLETAARDAEQLGYKPTKALALLTLGVAFEEKKDYDKALSAYKDALLITQESGDYWTSAWAWKNIGDVYEKWGKEASSEERERKWLQAIDAYWQSVRLMEKVRSGAGKETMLAQFAQVASEPFYRLIDLLARMGRMEEAFEVSERIKARALLELISEAALLEKEGNREQEEGDYLRLKRRVAELEERLMAEMASPSPNWKLVEQMQKELTDARNELEMQRDFSRLRRWQLLPVRNQQIAYDAWRKIELPNDTAVLVFVVMEQRTWLFLLTCGKGAWKIERYELPVTQKQLEEDIAWLRENLVQHRPIGATLARLYFHLIAPAEKSLKGRRKLIIVPDGPLFGLPFQVLQDENGVYLVERFAISYSPSLTTLWAVSQGKAEAAKSSSVQFVWTGLAVSDFGSLLKPLPFACEEVSSIAEMLKRTKKLLSTRVFVNSTSTKPAAIRALKESLWVHFATHAVLEPKRPLYSRLILKSSNEGEGVLRAFEILDLGQTGSQMVVLSACETGLGEALKGEGLLGLAWAFMATGTKTLVVSQWQVDDLSTSRLMQAFYRYLLNGLSPSEALGKAQVYMLSQRQFRHPYHWAGFVVWGKGW